MPKLSETEGRRHRRPPLIQRVSAALGRIGTLRPIRPHDHHGRGAGRTSSTDAPLFEQSDDAHLVGARLAAIIKSSQDAIVGKDLSGIITDWNPAAERLFGYSAGEAIGSRIMMLLPAGREQEERDILDRISRGEVVEHFETQRRHKHGHLVDVQVTISPILDLAGRVIGASKIARDITAAKRVEAELRQHRENLEVLVVQRTAQIAETTARLEERGRFMIAVTDSLPSAVAYWDHERRCRFSNKMHCEWVGYSLGEILGRRFDEVINPARWPTLQPLIDAAMRGEPQSSESNHHTRTDGSIVRGLTHYIPYRRDGEVVGVFAVVSDVTPLKLIEDELRVTNERLEERGRFIIEMSDSLPSAVGYWDHEERCRFSNRMHSAWFGYTNDEILGRTIEELFGPERYAAVRPYAEAAMNGVPQMIEPKYTAPDGTPVNNLAHFIPYRRDGRVVGFFSVVTNITAVKQIERELRLTNERLEDALLVARQASAAKSRFLANMSHEIRTPMNGVLGMLEILGHSALDDDQRRIMSTISGSARSLLDIIDDILDLSKIEAGQLEIEEVAADPAEIVEGATKLFLGAAAAKGLALRCFVGPSVRGRYLIDPVRIRQILSNLASNAIKFTAGGRVTVTADVIEDANGSSRLAFVVTDTGMGISPAIQARLFQPFTQGDASTARKFGGTGLGLSICRKLAGLMGGEIGLRSDIGKGTQITVTLPARKVEQDSPEETLDLLGVRVALMTGDVEERKYIARCLEYWGADVKVLAPEECPAPQRVDPFTVLVAPFSVAESGWLERNPEAIRVGPPKRFVFYLNEDFPSDRKLNNHSIVTTSLSRSRIVTAVAIAVGRKSPEVEIVSETVKPAIWHRVASRSQAEKEGRLILLAEDHPVNREVILRQLHLMGYAADAVENGAEALDALSKTKYGLLLTDCSMPELDGFELTWRIRQGESEGGPRLPIIALTANALDGEEAKCLAAGMDGYLSKPVELATLRDRLQQWVRPEDPEVEEAGQGRKYPNPTNAETELPVLDLSLLAQYCGEDTDAVNDTIATFLKATHMDIERLSSAVEKSDAAEAQLLSHRIKGAARFVGGARIAACSEAFERSASEADWAAMARGLPELATAAHQVERLYREMTSS